LTGVTSSPLRIFWLLAAAFYLNDFVFIYWSGQPSLYFADYAVRIFVLTLCLGLPEVRAITFQTLSTRRWGWVPLLLVIPMLVVVDRAAHKFVEPVIVEQIGRTGLFYFGRIENIPLRVFDLTVGLMLVAISEELVFRKFALHWLRNAGCGALACILISASIFATMHWGSGVNRVASAFVFGAIAMAVYLRHTRLWPLIVAHYLSNFIGFADFD